MPTYLMCLKAWEIPNMPTLVVCTKHERVMCVSDRRKHDVFVVHLFV